jgi:hypothetical protein
MACHAAGTDIPAINIQRARDHGVPDYNTCRRAFSLPAAKTFADITPDEQVAATLKALYGNVNNIGKGDRIRSRTSGCLRDCAAHMLFEGLPVVQKRPTSHSCCIGAAFAL